MTATRLTLAVAALAAGTFLLTGCEPANSTAGSGGGGTTCDPNGWGPLSGCGNADSANGPEPAAPTPTPAPTPAPDADRKPTPASEDNDSTADDEPTTENVSTPENNVTISVTWIVVSIDITGFRECVIGLREAPPSSDDHFSRRITSPEDCEAQQVDTVYRPVDK